MTNKKRKGFTIVELVIVIAVIAILAGVLIPTFTSIIDKANQSTDIQAVRQMNVLLKAESVENEPTGIGDVINIVAKAGYDTEEKLTPKSKSNYFYWHSGTNTIFLAKVEESKELIYPKDNDVLTTNFNTLELTKENGFHELVQSYKDNPPSAGDNETENNNTEGNNVTTNDPVVLKNALEAGKNVTLSGPVTITTVAEVFEISSSVTTASLDLNGHTLTIAAPEDEEKVFENVVYGTLTITNNSNDPGEIVIQGGKLVNTGYGAFWVRGGGTLKIDKVNIEGNRTLNIYSDPDGTINLTDTIYTINYGKGISSSGTTTITRGQFIAAGNGVCSVYSNSNLNINGTDFTTNDGVTYSGNEPSPIFICGSSRATLTDVDVKVNTQVGNTVNYSVYTVGQCSVTITRGSFEGAIVLDNYTTLFLNGGTFKKGTAYVDFAKGVYSPDGGTTKNDISVATMDGINEIISSRYKTKDLKTYYSIIETKVTKNDGTQETTYALFFKHDYTYTDSVTNDSDKLFGGNFIVDDKLTVGSLTVDQGEEVTMYINDQGFYIENNFVVEEGGTLNIVCGDIRPAKLYKDKRIIVKSGGTLNISGGVQFTDKTYEQDGFNANFKTFVTTAVDFAGGTFKFNDQIVTKDSSDKVYLGGTLIS